MVVPISRVVVHPDGAVVTRQGRIAVAGDEARITALPLLLDPTSVRVSLGGAPIRQVRVEIDFDDEDRGPKPEQLEAWANAVDELALVEATVEGARKEREVLARLAPKHVDLRHRDLPDAAHWAGWAAAETAIDEAVARLDAELRALDRRQRELTEQIQLLARKVEEASDQSWWRRWQPTRRVSLQLTGATEVEVELSYRVPGARWSPAYTLDADGALRAGRFAMRAALIQSTGEDWSQVHVSLTSAPSQRHIDVPELAALRLGSRSPPATPAWRALPGDLDGLFPEAWAPPPTQVTEFQLDDRDGDDFGRSFDQEEAEPVDALGYDDDVNEPTAEIAAPMPMSAPQYPRSKGGVLSGIAGAVVGTMGGAVSEVTRAVATRAPNAAPAAPPAFGVMSADLSVAKPMMRGAPRGDAGGRGAGRARRLRGPVGGEDESGEAEVADSWLDYGRLRLAGPDAGVGQRGRLRPSNDAEVLRERKAPPSATERLAEWLGVQRTEARRVADRPMAPHHVLPGPIGGSDVRIDAAGAVDVPSDGLPHTIAVTTWPVELEVAYRAVPRLDPRAFRRVTATVPYDRPLLPGPVDVYVDGRLELTSPWAGSAGRGKLMIGLGAEDRLKVVRNVRYREESAGLFGGSRRLQTAIEVKVASSLPRTVTVEVLDRVPVPLEGKDIGVELGDCVPPVQPYTGEPDGPILKGGKRQRLEVAPGAEVRAELTYALTLPGKDELVGGDRRG